MLEKAFWRLLTTEVPSNVHDLITLRTRDEEALEQSEQLGVDREYILALQVADDLLLVQREHFSVDLEPGRVVEVCDGVVAAPGEKFFFDDEGCGLLGEEALIQADWDGKRGEGRELLHGCVGSGWRELSAENEDMD